MKHLYLTFLSIGLMCFSLGLKMGLFIVNLGSEKWHNLGWVEDFVLLMIIPLFGLAIYQYSKFKKWLIQKQYLKDIEDIGV